MREPGALSGSPAHPSTSQDILQRHERVDHQRPTDDGPKQAKEDARERLHEIGQGQFKAQKEEEQGVGEIVDELPDVISRLDGARGHGCLTSIAAHHQACPHHGERP